jgi:hypothetical protein
MRTYFQSPKYAAQALAGLHAPALGLVPTPRGHAALSVDILN